MLVVGKQNLSIISSHLIFSCRVVTIGLFHLLPFCTRCWYLIRKALLARLSNTGSSTWSLTTSLPWCLALGWWHVPGWAELLTLGSKRVLEILLPHFRSCYPASGICWDALDRVHDTSGSVNWRSTFDRNPFVLAFLQDYLVNLSLDVRSFSQDIIHSI